MGRLKKKHFIDTCILMEILLAKKSSDKRDCERYLKRIGNLFAGVMSIPVLGEFTKVAIEDSDEPG